MIRPNAAVVSMLVVVLLAGCKENGQLLAKDPPSGDPAKPADDPAKLTAQEKELAELDRQIAAKEKELDDLKARASALRAGLGKAIDPRRTLHKSLAELFDLPKESQPKGGANGAPERKAANDWMKANRVGHEFEWTTTIKINPQEESGAFAVYLILPDHASTPGGVPFAAMLGKPTLGDATWIVAVASTTIFTDRMEAGIAISPVNDETAKKLREFDGKKVTLRATIKGAKFDYPFIDDRGDLVNICMLDLSITMIEKYRPPILPAK